MTFSAQDDSILASGSDDTSVKLWDVKSRDSRPIMSFEEAKDGVSAIVVDDGSVISGSVDGRVRTYDLRMGRVTVDVMPGAVTSLDLSRDGRTVLVGCLDGRIRMMDRTDGTCLRAFPEEGEQGYKNESLRLKSCFGRNEGLVLSGSEGDGDVRAWDVLSGKKISNVQVGAKAVSVVKWREGSQAQARQSLWAAAGADGVVKVYVEG